MGFDRIGVDHLHPVAAGERGDAGGVHPDQAEAPRVQQRPCAEGVLANLAHFSGQR